MVEPAPATILVVDRDECIRELLRLHLEKAGYRVIVAEDAVLAVRSVLRDPPDLIIADVNMRYLDGLEFLAALREDGSSRRIPLVFITDSDVRVARAVALGAGAYLTKPVVASRLISVVAEQLARVRFRPRDLSRPDSRAS